MNHQAAQRAGAGALNRARSRAWARAAGSIVGLGLLAAAIWVAIRQREALGDAFSRAANAPWWLLAAALLLPLASWTLTAVMYWTLMNRPGRWSIGLGEMHWVLASAWLMNFLPARPGMFGRIAYHTLVNRVPLPFVISSSVAAILCGGVGVGALLAVSIVAWRVHLGAAASAVAIAAPAALLAGLGRLGVFSEDARRFLLASAVRYLDVLAWMARYECAFTILGRPLGLVEAAALTAVSQAATLVPFVGNGLGIREWAIGLTGPALPAGFATGTALSRGLSISADLINRAAEVTVALPVGIVGGLWVARRMRGRSPLPAESALDAPSL